MVIEVVWHGEYHIAASHHGLNQQMACNHNAKQGSVGEK